jgi:hypothetical protein
VLQGGPIPPLQHDSRDSPMSVARGVQGPQVALT